MREVEAVLYGNGFAEQTGAVYRLLKRSGVQGRTLARTRTQAPANLCPILNLYSPHQPRSPPSLRKIGTAIKLALIARSKQVDFKSIPIVSSRSNQWSALHIDCTLLGPRVSSLHTLRHLLISWLLGAPAHVNCEIFAHGFRSKCGGLG